MYIVLFSVTTEALATEPSHWERVHGGHRAMMPTPPRGDRVHRVGHDELHHRSLRSATIFGPCRPHLRSDQLRSAIARRRRSATRGQKKADVSVQSRGQVGLSRAAGRGNRIFSAGHVRLCYSFGQRVNFLSRPPAAPTATCGRGTHTHGLRSPRARGAGRGGTALLQ